MPPAANQLDHPSHASGPAATNDTFTTHQVAQLTQLPAHRIRAFARAGLVGTRRACPPSTTDDLRAGTGAHGAPRHRYSFQDLRLLRTIASLLDQGLRPSQAHKALAALKATPDAAQPATPLCSETLATQGGRLLAINDGQTWDPQTGQAHLPFEGENENQNANTDDSSASGTVITEDAQGTSSTSGDAHVSILSTGLTTTCVDPTTDAQAWFDTAAETEPHDPHTAYQAYLKALELDPEHVDALINVGRICSEQGQAQRAAAYFRQAIRTDPEHPVAHFNLGVAYDDLGHGSAAKVAYEQALHEDPKFADAHFNLYQWHQSRGQTQPALAHLAAYRRLQRPPADQDRPPKQAS